jgi:hypothetical protein
MFVHQERNHVEPTILAVYADDLMIALKCIPEILALKRLLSSKFKIKDLSEAKCFLG